MWVFYKYKIILGYNESMDEKIARLKTSINRNKRS